MGILDTLKLKDNGSAESMLNAASLMGKDGAVHFYGDENLVKRQKLLADFRIILEELEQAPEAVLFFPGAIDRGMDAIHAAFARFDAGYYKAAYDSLVTKGLGNLACKLMVSVRLDKEQGMMRLTISPSLIYSFADDADHEPVIRAIEQELVMLTDNITNNLIWYYPDEDADEEEDIDD